MSSSTVTTKSAARINTATRWSQYLHRRVMRLLLQHDRQLFQGHFRVFYSKSTLPKLPLFQLYDSYLKLLLLKDELLDDIVPRIRRQLSLQNNQLTMQEEAPTQGEIDWPRTILRTLNETPDLPPLRFDTNQQQRNMVTPENLFVVAILLHYRRAVQDLLKKDLADETLSDQERQQLVEIEERLERELAAPYAHPLVAEARSADLEQLAEYVRKSLLPGNSAYRDLFHWWEQFSALQIGHAADRNQLALMSKRSNENSNAWLYELWIVLELIHLLDGLHLLMPADTQIDVDSIRLLFPWNARTFVFTYHRQTAADDQKIVPGWQHIPVTHTRFTIEREKPLEVQPQDVVLWREPPVILDAHYPQSEHADNGDYTPHLQKLLGELRLYGAQHGVLFAPTLPEPAPGEYAMQAQRDPSLYTEGMSYNLADPKIRLSRCEPGMDLAVLQERFKALLNDVTSAQTLPERPEPACHGILLDTDTINDGRFHPGTYNTLCPKPHIGPGVFDLVQDKIHCLKDPHLCHIYGQAKLVPFVIRASTQDAMNKQNRDIRNQADEMLRQAEQDADEERAEQLRSRIFLGVGRTVEQYVKLRGNTATIEEQFEEWIFGKYWKSHPRCLAEETRNILLSGAYVWNEYKQTKLDDWAAPAIQYCRALEAEIKRRLHDYYPDPRFYYSDIRQTGFDVPSRNMTLGAIETMYQLKKRDLSSARDNNERKKIETAKHNWDLCSIIVTGSGTNIEVLEAIIQQMIDGRVSRSRNELAHGGPISETLAQQLRETILGNKNKVGLLYRLVESIEPQRVSRR